MEHADIAQVAALCGALGSALVLLARGRATLLAGLVVLAAAEAGLLGALGGDALGKLSSGAGALAGASAAVALALAAALLVRHPGWTAVALLIAAPFRPPLDFDSSNRFFVALAEDGRLGRLLPLYFVLAAAALALGWRTLRGREVRALPPALALPSAAFFALAFASLTWADDIEAGANLLAFFTLPFAALLTLVARSALQAWSARALATAALSLGCLFAAVGIWQAATHELFFYAPNLAVSNANTDFFRVTSLFGDPSLYGRHLVLAMGVALTLLATRSSRAWPVIAALALMWVGLLFSYSQSSMAALLLVALALALATGDRAVRRSVAVAALVALVVAAGFAAVKVAGGESLNRVTSDRTERVEDAAEVIERNPVVGVGIGGQPRASREIAESNRPNANFVSHTTPLTVAAELGLVGLALYAWLLVGGVSVIGRVWRGAEALGLALGASLLALFVHALFYSGFLEDPITWLVLGLGAAWVMSAGSAAEPVRDPGAAVPAS